MVGEETKQLQNWYNLIQVPCGVCDCISPSDTVVYMYNVQHMSVDYVYYYTSCIQCIHCRMSLLVFFQTIDCSQVSLFRQLQLTKGSPGRSTVHTHLQTQEDMERGAIKEEEVSDYTHICTHIIVARMHLMHPSYGFATINNFCLVYMTHLIISLHYHHPYPYRSQHFGP